MPIEQPGRIRGKQIGDGEINSRLIATNLQSDNYDPGFSGWLISRVTGNVEFNEGTFRGNVAISGNLEVSGDDGILVKDGGDITVISGGSVIINGGQLVAGPTTVDASGVQVGDDVVIDSTGLHVAGGEVQGLWVDSARSISQNNVTVTTTTADVQSLVVDPPSWVQVLWIFATASYQGDGDVVQNLECKLLMDDGGASELGPLSNEQHKHEAGVGQMATVSVSSAHVVPLSPAGRTVTITEQARVSTGTNTSNRHRLDVISFGVRSAFT